MQSIIIHRNHVKVRLAAKEVYEKKMSEQRAAVGGGEGETRRLGGNRARGRLCFTLEFGSDGGLESNVPTGNPISPTRLVRLGLLNASRRP